MLTQFSASPPDLALVFASPEPITPKLLFKLLADEPKEDVTAAVMALKADYENRPGLQWTEVAGGYQIVTRPELHEWVRRLFHERSTQKLTVQALETLAVIAYKQPITALEIGEIRGVNTSGVLATLLERHLIKIVGRKNVVGRPFLANPDLAERWRTGAELNEPDPDTFYGGGAEGYTDYPTLDQVS